MAWTIPKYQDAEINNAGAKLISLKISENELDAFLEVINNFRSSHAYPLTIFQNGLRKKAKQVDSESLIAQRIKRLSSIDIKLRRFKWLKLSAMQDIGGCRAIVKSVKEVNRLVQIYKKSDIKHKLIDEDDYIQKPKKSGYRGVHLIYSFYSDKNKKIYNGSKIEIQIRSRLQHAWATAVETVGTFTKQALKSNQGEAGWLRFFALMGTAISIRESTPQVPETPGTKKELIKELRHYVQELDVIKTLNAYGSTLKTLDNDPNLKDAHYFLLSLDPIAQETRVIGFKGNELEKATESYLSNEKNIVNNPGAETVLVSVEKLKLLRRAYPNYFLDTKVFIETVNQALN